MQAIQFNPVNEANIFNTIKSTLNDLIGWKVFIVSIFSTSVFPINTGLGIWITRIYGGLELDSCSTTATVAILNLEKTAGIVRRVILQGGEMSEEEPVEEDILCDKLAGSVAVF
jgi:hypothetical protein